MFLPSNIWGFPMFSCKVSQSTRVDGTPDEVSGPGGWSFECPQWSPAKPPGIVGGLRRSEERQMAMAMATIDQFLDGLTRGFC